MSIANPSEAKTGKGWAPGSTRYSQVRPRMNPPEPKRPARTSRTSEVYTAHPLYGQGDWVVFKWLLFFVLILAAILAFVSWVMGIPIPGFSGFQQNPFNQ